MTRKTRGEMTRSTGRRKYRSPAEETLLEMQRDLRIERDIVRGVERLQRAIERSDASLLTLGKLIDLQMIGRRNRLPIGEERSTSSDE